MHPFLKVVQQAMSIFGTVEINEVPNETIEVKITGFQNKLKNVNTVNNMLEPLSETYPIVKKYDVDEGKFHLILGHPKQANV